MAQYIDKAALIAEIEDWRDKIKKGIFSIPLSGSERAYAAFEYEVLGKVISFLDKFEVKEVDLEKEIKRFTMSKELYEADSAIKAVAEHFFELGLKTHKGE